MANMPIPKFDPMSYLRPDHTWRENPYVPVPYYCAWCQRSGESIAHIIHEKDCRVMHYLRSYRVSVLSKDQIP